VAAIAWAGPALEDLRQIYQFIARDSRQYASIMVRGVRTAVSRLGDFPKRGCVVPELPEGPYREILVGPYRVVYRYVENRDIVLVLAVIHGSRLLPPLLEDR
jgi:plasmid stabilization system protein ParE